LQPIQGFPQEQQQTQEDWGQWIQGGAKAAPAANLNIDLNLPADGLLQPAENQGNLDMELNPDLNEVPLEAFEEPQNNEVQQHVAQLSFIPSEVPPNEDETSTDTSCNHPSPWEASPQSKALEVYHASDPSNVAILGLPTIFPEPIATIAADAVPDLELMLPGDLLQEIDHVPQVNQNLHVGFMRHLDTKMIDPVFESFSMTVPPAQKPADMFRLWGKFFSPPGDPRAQISISFD
jgi:hypothetical protein